MCIARIGAIWRERILLSGLLLLQDELPLLGLRGLNESAQVQGPFPSQGGVGSSDYFEPVTPSTHCFGVQ